MTQVKLEALIQGSKHKHFSYKMAFLDLEQCI